MYKYIYIYYIYIYFIYIYMYIYIYIYYIYTYIFGIKYNCSGLIFRFSSHFTKYLKVQFGLVYATSRAPNFYPIVGVWIPKTIPP